MFHAALVIAISLHAKPSSPDATTWTKDLDTVRALLSIELSKNKLAMRCLAILEGLRPQANSDGDDQQSLLFEPNEGMGHFGLWPINAADSPNSDWLDFGQDFL